ncbi:MAG: amino acid adenylation domain-containing protein, partial [Bacteroidaceae bacterium]|nr:amino acid adenylation domain-containing protein [Bacteroidaceae bacterium]
LLLEVMKEHLHVDELGVTTNLVSMGLSSIGAMRLSAQLFQHHNLRVSVKDIIEHPTVREMAELAGTEETVLYKPYEKRRTYPLSEAQRGMLVDCLINADALQYNIACALKYKDMDVERLKRAIVAVCEAHPYIKARIKAEDGDYVQLRNDDEPVEIEEQKLDFEPDRAFLQSQVQPFDVLNEKLYRFRLFTAPSYTYLFIDIHHLISDGSSNYILAREMEKAYNGESLVREEYTAFDRAIDEENIMKSERGAEAEQYFDNLINGTEATVYPHSAEMDSEAVYGELTGTIPSEAILTFCKENAIAPSSFFLTVFHHVLQRVTRDESTLVYFISNGRSEVQLENFFGVFVKTMPTVVSSFNGNIVESVRAMHRQMLDTIAHDYYPFTKMTERHGLKAEILYNYFVDLQTSMDLGSGAVESIGLDWDTAKTPLSVTITRDEDGNFVSSLEYDARLYNEYDMRSLNRAYCAFAENCVKCAGPLSHVSLIPDDDLPGLKALALGKKMRYDSKKTFPSIFTEQAVAHPDNIAVVSEEASYTYAQLESQSNALAHYLIDNGVKAGEFVCVSMPGCVDFVTAAIGIEKAGAAYVPVDPEYPEERKQYMQEDCEARIVVTQELLQKVDWSRNESINLAVPDGIAYMIYTSGSTGKPKGVMIPHKAKTHFVNFIAKEWHHTEKSRICCHSSVSFDASIEDLYPVLTVGGTLYIVPQAARKDMEMLHDFIVDNGITGGCYTTQLGQMLLQQYPDLPVDYLVVGGEKMTTAPKCKCRLINTYGPTEFTVDATYFDVEPGREYKNIPIGRALHNQAAYVVDSQNQLAPQGIAGELCMAGVQISAGYWRRDDLTAEKFTGCGFADGIIYHTGDLVKYNKDGQLEYLGRIDSQVKLRGFRIELGEIETLIAGFKGVRMVSVQVREVGGVQHLCAYYSADSDIDKDVLKTFLAAQLTEYMVPTAYIQLDEMPLTPNGKVNTKALPLPEIQAEEIVAPETETEKKLFDIAVELLKHDQFGVTSNLISMGLTSLSAMQLTAFLQQRLEVIIPVTELLSTPVIRAIAAGIDSNKFKSTKKAAIFTKRETPADPPSTEGPASARANPFEKKSNPFVPKKNPFEKK